MTRCILEDLITTSQHIADLSEATDEDIESAMSLPVGFSSCFRGDNVGTFVMLREDSKIYTGFQHEEDGMASYAPGDQNYEKLLGFIRSEKGHKSEDSPEDSLNSVELLINAICKRNQLDKGSIEIVFSVAIVSASAASR